MFFLSRKENKNKIFFAHCKTDDDVIVDEVYAVDTRKNISNNPIIGGVMGHLEGMKAVKMNH